MKKRIISLFLALVMVFTVLASVDLSVYADSANPSESKQYQMFKADYYSKNFNFSTPSFAREYYDEMKSDTAFMTFLATWEVAHIATSPSHAMESGMITLKEYYKTVLFDLFAQSNSESGITDQLLKMVKNSELSYIVSITKTISKPLSEISQDNISYEGLSKISAQDAADAIKKSGLYQGTETYGIVTKIAGWAKDAKSLVEAFSKYLAIADLNDGTKEILNIIANDSQNPNELREAAADCVSYFGEGYEKVLNQILAGTWDITVGVFDTVADVALDWAWGMIIGSITTATGGAIGSAVLLGAKGIRVFSNFLFNVDKDVESFYQIKAAVVCEDAMKRVIANIHNQGYLSSSFELSNLYNQAVEAFEKTVLLGFDYSIGLLKNSAEAPAIKYTNLLFGKYDECMDLINQISGFKNDKIQIFSKFEDKCLNAFKKEYCLDFDDVIYGLEHQNIPIDSIELTQIKDFTVGLTNECMFNYVKAEFLPEAHTEIAFESWRSSDNSVIEIVNDTSFTVHKEGSCMLTCYLSSGVSADITVTVGESQGGYEYDYDNFEFSFNDNDLTAEITDYTGSVSRLAIPSKIGKYTVTSIGYRAFEDCTSLTSITIPDSVTNIGDDAFYGCTSLTSITIPDSVTNIGRNAFDKTAYYNSTSNWENGVVLYIDNCLIEARFNKISDDYSIKPGTRVIASLAFDSCTSLTSVTIPNSVTNIGYWAFRSCKSLTSIIIPDSVTSISDRAFDHCTSLQGIYVNVDNKDYRDIDGVLFNKDATEIVRYPGGKSGNYKIPHSVTSIGDNAFSDCESLTSVTIGNGVTSIGDAAFSDCTSLTSITIPNSITSIGFFTFGGCTSLTSVTIPDSVTSIGQDAFYGCTSLTSITIPDSVTSIGINAFQHCTVLTDITISNSVTSIGGFAFNDCTSLTSITIPDSVTSIESCTFAGCTALTDITIPDSVTNIESDAFYNTAYYNTESNWGNGVLYIGKHLIKAKSTVSGAYTIHTGTKAIAKEAFENCTSLTSITISESVTSIGDWTFNGCTALKNIFVDAGNVNYSDIDGVLFNKDATELIRCPEGKSGSYTIPDSVTRIGYDAFENCIALTGVTIPESVTSIGNGAFRYCKALTIYGFSGSYAESYAKRNGIPFVVIGKQEIMGDMNADGKINAVDARWALQSASGVRTLSDEQFAAADVNGDGKITAVDARWILQAASGVRVL